MLITFYSKDFINTLSEKLGEKIVYSEIDEVAKEALPVYFIASGGAENGFYGFDYLWNIVESWGGENGENEKLH